MIEKTKESRHTEEFHNLLRQKEYRFMEVPRVSYRDFEQLRKFGEVHNIFEDLTEQLNRPPTQYEYVKEGLVRAEHFFKQNTKRGYRWFVLEKNPDGSNRWGKFNWDTDNQLQLACLQRLSRTYQSRIVELSTYYQLLDLQENYDIDIGVHEYLDLILGSDIAIRSREYNKTAYFHVASSTGARWIEKKAKRTINLSENDVYRRDFSKNHHTLAFNLEESETTTLVNGNPTLRTEYIEQKVQEALMNTYSDSYQAEQVEDIKKRLEKSTYFSSLEDKDIWVTNPLYHD